jgi:hypothetical protein
MLATIMQYIGLIEARTRLHATETNSALTLYADIEAAVAERYTALMDAIDGHEDPVARMHGRRALAALEKHTEQIARVERVLDAIAHLPADIAAPGAIARLLVQRDGHRADQARNMTVLADTTQGAVTL